MFQSPVIWPAVRSSSFVQYPGISMVTSVSVADITPCTVKLPSFSTLALWTKAPCCTLTFTSAAETSSGSSIVPATFTAFASSSSQTQLIPLPSFCESFQGSDSVPSVRFL